MAMQNGLPDHIWNNRELLARVLADDDNEDWTSVRGDANECVQLDSSIAMTPDDDVMAFLEQRGRAVMERAARRLLGYGHRRAVLAVLRDRLAEVALFAAWMARTEQGPVPAFDVVLRRSCNVGRWLLNPRMRELQRLGINSMTLAAQVSAVEADVKDESARKAVQLAASLLEHCLPLTRNEMSDGTPDERRAPKPIAPLEEGMRYTLVITNTGFRIEDSLGRVHHVAALQKRLRSLLLAAWADSYTEIGDNGMNRPLSVSFSLRRLKRWLGKTANRTNVCELRKHLRCADGLCLMGDGEERPAVLDVCVDAKGQTPHEALRRFLKEHDIRVPERTVG